MGASWLRVVVCGQGALANKLVFAPSSRLFTDTDALVLLGLLPEREFNGAFELQIRIQLRLKRISYFMVGGIGIGPVFDRFRV